MQIFVNIMLCCYVIVWHPIEFCLASFYAYLICFIHPKYILPIEIINLIWSILWWTLNFWSTECQRSQIHSLTPPTMSFILSQSFLNLLLNQALAATLVLFDNRFKNHWLPTRVVCTHFIRMTIYLTYWWTWQGSEGNQNGHYHARRGLPEHSNT